MEEFNKNQAKFLTEQFTEVKGQLEDSALHSEHKKNYVAVCMANIGRLQQNPTYETLVMSSESLMFAHGMLSEHKNAMINGVSGLPNRLAFNRELDNIIQRTERDHDSNDRVRYAMLYIDGDEFGELNEALGHLGGDQAIKELGQILEETSRGGEEIYHWGGDEFAVFLRDEHSKTDAEAKEHFENALERFKAPFEENTITYNNKTRPLSASLGFYIINDDDFVGLSDTNKKEMIQNVADNSVYDAKNDRAERLNRIWNIIDNKQSQDPPQPQ
ncbi:MAG: GGDEF domain-containing protein [Alphaproteobacteria bacterium]